MLYTVLAVLLVVANADSCSGDTVTIDIGVCESDCDDCGSDMITCTNNVASNFMYDDAGCEANEQADGSATVGVCGELWGWKGFDAMMVSCDATSATFEFCGDTANNATYNVCGESVAHAESMDGCTACRCEEYCCGTENTEAYSYSMWGVWEVECACGTESEMNQRVIDFDADWCEDSTDCELLPSHVGMCDPSSDDAVPDAGMSMSYMMFSGSWSMSGSHGDDCPECDTESDAYVECMMGGGDCTTQLTALGDCYVDECDTPAACQDDFETFMECYISAAVAGTTPTCDDTALTICYMSNDGPTGDVECDSCFAENLNCFDDDDNTDCDCVCNACLTECETSLEEFCAEGSVDDCIAYCEGDNEADSSEEFTLCDDSASTLVAVVVAALLAIMF